MKLKIAFFIITFSLHAAEPMKKSDFHKTTADNIKENLNQIKLDLKKAQEQVHEKDSKIAEKARAQLYILDRKAETLKAELQDLVEIKKGKTLEEFQEYSTVLSDSHNLVKQIQSFYESNPNAKISQTIANRIISEDLDLQKKQKEIQELTGLADKVRSTSQKLKEIYVKPPEAKILAQPLEINDHESLVNYIERQIEEIDKLSSKKRLEQHALKSAQYESLKEVMEQLSAQKKIPAEYLARYQNLYDDILLKQKNLMYAKPQFVAEKLPDERQTMQKKFEGIEGLPVAGKAVTLRLKPELTKGEQFTNTLKSWGLEIKLLFEKTFDPKKAAETAERLADVYADINKEISSVSTRLQASKLAKMQNDVSASQEHLKKAVQDYNNIQNKNSEIAQAALDTIAKDIVSIYQIELDTYAANLDYFIEESKRLNTSTLVANYRKNGGIYNQVKNKLLQIIDTMQEFKIENPSRYIDFLKLDISDPILADEIITDFKKDLKDEISTLPIAPGELARPRSPTIYQPLPNIPD